MIECRHCDGVGWIVDVDTRCCGRSEYECGGRGCTGAEPEQIQLQCECCGGTGKTNHSQEHRQPPVSE